MIYDIVATNKYKKDLINLSKRGKNIDKIEDVVNKLANGEKLDDKFYDHKLKGIYEGYKECHIEPDWILVYRIEKEKLILVLVRTGRHQDVFNEKY